MWQVTAPSIPVTPYTPRQLPSGTSPMGVAPRRAAPLARTNMAEHAQLQILIPSWDDRARGLSPIRIYPSGGTRRNCLAKIPANREKGSRARGSSSSPTEEFVESLDRDPYHSRRLTIHETDRGFSRRILRAGALSRRFGTIFFLSFFSAVTRKGRNDEVLSRIARRARNEAIPKWGSRVL